MTMEDAQILRPGDEVFWNDPDKGLCSTMLTIRTIEIHDEIVVITHDTGELECFVSELE